MATGRYIPPHLRGKSALPQEEESVTTYTSSSLLTPPSKRASSDSVTIKLPPPNRPFSKEISPSPTPTSTRFNAVAGPSRLPIPASTIHSGIKSTGKYEPPAARNRNASPNPSLAPSPAPGPKPRRGVTGPSLYVFGDSFVGPMKLLDEDCVRPTTFKGASAKGLNNPDSLKQVSKDLLPQLNVLMAPPTYAYMPGTGRWAMLMFGNVDLQINYLWQLQHKRLSHLSFPPSTTLPEQYNSSVEESDTITRSNSHTVLANATDTSLTGPALGPELFVGTVMKNYTAWLDREIVNGPIGHTLQANAEARKSEGQSQSGGRRIWPGKLLIAAALPPLVEDDTLYRIPEKYVTRLEEEHEERARRMERNGSSSSWRNSPIRGSSPKLNPGSLPIPLDPYVQDEVDLLHEVSAKLTLESERPPTPLSTSSSSTNSSQPDSTLFDTIDTATSSSLTEIDTAGLISKPPDTTSTKTSIKELLEHDPPLCTLPIRVSMTNHFNTLLKEYCEKYPDIFGLVDISASMQMKDIESGWKGGIHGEVDRGTWACPVDPTNIHPLWEVTLPLWLEELGKAGVPVEGFKISQSAEETFKAYELDKRRRTALGESEGRVKIREE